MRLTSICLVMWLYRIVATGLQTTHTNFTNVLCIVQKWQVWCTVSSHAIIGPYFFENAKGGTVTMNAERCRVMPATFLRDELHPRQQHLSWFQQDGATAHTAQISMQVLRTMFPGRLISRFGNITWPAWSPDFGVPCYFLWGYVTSKVYETRPVNIDDKTANFGVYSRDPQGNATTYYGRLSSLPQECIERIGGHLQSVIFKQ
jgi:hypothetical protein